MPANISTFLAAFKRWWHSKQARADIAKVVALAGLMREVLRLFGFHVG